MEKIAAVHFTSTGETYIRQEVDLFILLKFLIIRWSCVVFIQYFSIGIGIGNASWENVHAAIVSVIVDYQSSAAPYQKLSASIKNVYIYTLI